MAQAGTFQRCGRARSMGDSEHLGNHGRGYALLWRYGNEDIERFNDKAQQLAAACQNLSSPYV